MIKKVWGMYFTGTETTKKVVNHIGKNLANKLNVEFEEYDFSLPSVRKVEKSFTTEDLVVFGVPVIAGRVPNLLLKYLDTLKGNGALAVPVVLYGNRNFDDALIELRNILNDKGLKPIAGGAFIGEHSFSTILGAGRPDEKDMDIATSFATSIFEKITSKDFDPDKLVEVKGETPIRFYYQPRDSKGNPIDIRKVKPKTNKDLCTKCGTCVAICPMGSINPEDPSDVFGICMKCCACVKRCPNGAKYYDDANYLYHQHELEDQYASTRKEPELFL
ncbi:EFR1 family ferrodoxin [Fusobacterium perfoetens]|uniref:EFR1 family ferrodoxin n=1 Tax=Fusobacterium perfoetens TaxID=852 RepID=UPI000AD37257|nr:EFR1 family ferrodoxin [Fusobacterium perfoetens]MCI6153004.1 EFR1 family ferrodoxin [Fusobacterium perfoetens]MDY3237401.1 EFR1 family ferrodoxin [Fusobacterium perfoetens]